MNQLTIALGLLVCTLGAGCSTVETRIQDDPATYGRLSPRNQLAVRAGEIHEGFSEKAVLLAWGRPDRKARVSERGEKFEVWNYYQYHHDYVPDYAYFPRPMGNYLVYNDVYAPRTVTRATLIRSVVFQQGRVVSWEIADD